VTITNIFKTKHKRNSPPPRKSQMAQIYWRVSCPFEYEPGTYLVEAIVCDGETIFTADVDWEAIRASEAPNGQQRIWEKWAMDYRIASRIHWPVGGKEYVSPVRWVAL